MPRVGLVGLGTVGKVLLELLKPFMVDIKLYDPYLPKEEIESYSNVEMCTLEEVLRFGSIISIHASLTGETRKMIGKDRLKMIRDGALLVNTSRGAILDESALIEELEAGRLSAVLDVFRNEPLDADSPLRKLENVITLPHVAGVPAREQMTSCIIEEIRRFVNGQPLEHEISFQRFKLMTKEI